MAVETNTIDIYYSLLEEVIEPTLKELKYEVLGTGKYAQFDVRKWNLMRDIPSKSLSGGSGVPAPVGQLAIIVINEYGDRESIALGLLEGQVIVNNIKTLGSEKIPLHEVTPETIKKAVLTEAHIKLEETNGN